jgi:O-antigen ligase
VATAGTLALRQGDLGFLQSWFGPPPETPGEYAASWSQRLIYTYVGGRVFLDRPVLGTGWHGELPPETFAEYLPDARERFSDQPPHYFPPADRGFIPQQTYDQVLFELGLVGAALFALLGVVAVRRAAAAARRRDTDAAYLPPAWLASLAGVLAGAALFGGSPLTAVFWLTLGVVAAEPEGQT